MMKYSFVIPCYKSGLTIRNVIEDISLAMSKRQENAYEIICVNDYPHDDTFSVLKDIANDNKHLSVIQLSRNFGQHAALIAGYNEAIGELIISLDDDGQTPPKEVFKMIDKIDDECDVVFAKYKKKNHTGFRNFGSKVNDKMAEILINKPKSLSISSYFVAKKYIIKEVIKYTDSYPYITGLVLRTTSFIKNVEIEHKERTVGDSNYSFKSLLKLWLNGFTAFSIKPLRVSMFLGLIVAFSGFCMTIYTLINYLINPLVPLGWSSTMAALTFIGGVILIVLGMIGEYLGRIYMAMNNAPQYIVKERVENGKDIQL